MRDKPMSDVPADLDLREQIARIDRMREETRKFSAEMNKLAAEQSKLAAEQIKLASEGRKFDRERGLAPWQSIAIALGAIAALVASMVSIAKSLGWLA